MKLEILQVGKARSNTYIIYDENTLEALIIDPGDLPKKIIQFVQENGLRPIKILLTHFHFDHMGAAKKLRKRFGCPICIHRDDQPMLRKQASWINKLLIPRVNLHPDQLLEADDIIRAGQVTLRVIHTPGHSPGGICLEVVGEKVIFTGDTIFAKSVGRFDFHGGNEMLLRKSLAETVNLWPDDVMIYPGHGRAAAMIQIRRMNNLFRLMVQQAQ